MGLYQDIYTSDIAARANNNKNHISESGTLVPLLHSTLRFCLTKRYRPAVPSTLVEVNNLSG